MFQALWWPPWRHHDIKFATKVRIYRTTVTSVLSYSSETGVLRMAEEHQMVFDIFLSCFMLNGRTRSEMRIFVAHPTNHVHQPWLGFSGFLGSDILLGWKTNKFQNMFSKECCSSANDPVCVTKCFSAAIRLPMMEVDGLAGFSVLRTYPEIDLCGT